MKMTNIKIVKKNGTVESFNPEKIKQAVKKSADRVLIQPTEEDYQQVVDFVLKTLDELKVDEISVQDLHPMVELGIHCVQPKVAESYRSYRNYKGDFAKMLDEVYRQVQTILYQVDHENANSDSALICTKRTFIAGYLMKELYKKFFLNAEELEAIEDGYIYIHDLTDRLLGSFNCCLFDVETVLNGGFELAHQWYNEPNTLDVACDVIGDIIMSASACQYGGFTISCIDKVLAKYARKSFKKHLEDIQFEHFEISRQYPNKRQQAKMETLAWRRLKRELEQGIQGFEIKLNTVASSRGSFPFTTFTFGLVDDEFEKLVAETILKVRKGGQGKEGFTRPVVFPKLVFLYTDSKHGIGAKHEDLFDLAIETCAVAMYPDILSLDAQNHVGEMYQKYGEVVSPIKLVA